MRCAFIAGSAVLLAVLACGQTVSESPTFEVASVKPVEGVRGPFIGSVPTIGCRGGPGSSDPGRFTCQNTSLSALIRSAYRLMKYQAVFPGWMDQTYFDIAAVVPAATTAQQFSLMQQKLLVDRFKLAAHFEKKEVEVLELRVTKEGPKFKESSADPEAPSAVRSAIATSGLRIDPSRISDNSLDYAQAGGRIRHFKKQTMEELALFLTSYSDRPVVDATGLAETYDIVLDFVRAPRSNLPPGVIDGAAGPDADAGPSLERALQSQLGLQLEPKKGPVDVLVIDHIQRTPTEN